MLAIADDDLEEALDANETALVLGGDATYRAHIYCCCPTGEPSKIDKWATTEVGLGASGWVTSRATSAVAVEMVLA